MYKYLIIIFANCNIFKPQCYFAICSIFNLYIMNFIFLLRLSWKSARRNNSFGNDILDFLFKYIFLISILLILYIAGSLLTKYGYDFLSNNANPLEFIYFYSSIAILIDLVIKIMFKRTSFRFAFIQQLPNTKRSIKAYWLYITIEKYTIFQLKSIPVLIVCEDKKSYLNAG